MIILDLVSKKTRHEFREYLVGASTLREIEGVFDSADIRCLSDLRPRVSGDRRTLIEQYYASLDMTSHEDAAKLLRAYEYVLIEALRTRTSDFGDEFPPTEAAKQLLVWLRKDGYTYSDGRITRIGSGGAVSVAPIRAVAKDFDGPHLDAALSRIESAVESDPALAIGQAKELVETCCKSILTKRGVTDDFEKMDLAPLVKRTAKELSLVPDAVPDSARGVDSIRRVLNNLASVAQGLAEIRNLYGTGHGKDAKHKGLGPRHARLAVGAASTLVTFLFHTHEDRNAK